VTEEKGPKPSLNAIKIEVPISQEADCKSKGKVVPVLN
jgi:hypothetical protein